MKAELVRFGVIGIDGQIYKHDIIIHSGRISKRSKKPSKPYKAQYGHTPLSVAEPIPWGGTRLIIGTGVYGQLPVMENVFKEAEERGVEVTRLPTKEACQLLGTLPEDDVYAVLHITC